MRVPTNGSSAYKYEREYVQPDRSVKKGISRKQRHKGSGGTLFAGVVVTALAFVLLFRYACITEMSATLTSLKGQYEEVNSVAVAKEFELEQEVDLNKVQEIASSELGMQKPEKHQIVYIDMQNTDYTESSVIKDSGSGFFAAVTGAWEKVWEYFS